MAAREDYLTILHVDDGKQWARFLSDRLNGPNYGIKTVLKDLNSIPRNGEVRPSSATSHTKPKKDNLHDSGRGSNTIPEVTFGSGFTDNAKALVFLLSPDVLNSEFFPVDVKSLNPKRSVFLFLGVEIEEVRAYFGQYQSHVFNSHCCIIHTDERSIADAMVQIIVAYEDQGGSSSDDDGESTEDPYKPVPNPRQLNSIEKVLTPEICGADRDVYFLLERAAEETLLVVLEKCDQLPVTCVCDRLYKFTLPASASGYLKFRVEEECRNHVVGKGSVLVLTKLDKLKSILSEEVNPLAAIAAALGLNSDDISRIDDALALKMHQLSPLKTFEEMFPCEEALNDSLTEERADATYPTLLHFAADLNLQKFCSELLRYPGMLSAAMTENKDGDDPSTLAFKKGYSHIEYALMQFVADHKTSEDSDYVQPLAPKPHAPAKAPGYVNVPQSVCNNNDLYIDMGEIRREILDSSSRRSDLGSESPVSHISEDVFSDKPSLKEYYDDGDQFSSRSRTSSQRSITASGATPKKALKIFGVDEDDIKREQTANLNKQYYRSIASNKPTAATIPHAVCYPGVTKLSAEQHWLSSSSNSDIPAADAYSKQKGKIAAFFGKIKSKRSASEGNNVYIPPRAMKKTQSARGDKLKKKSNEDNSQERDSGSYSDDENGHKIPHIAKKGSKPGVFKERENALTRKRPLSKRALIASRESVNGAPKVPDAGRRKESFTSFVEIEHL
ncbi:hypothetical protein BsWGS_05742 [Bradybaena similaris]